ncbi:hypothetical protein [Chryseobacterium caseinilyticum]|uniref:DUF4352 domain-containing protein n=1 Tax=Chryseobacterium caseinilyticum TaxID=2771428 RepID=A0ABR8ZB34_9FLAO|nr:hypothetical protein [Chryseobacterium caseinilyticum]MBD8082502.1 hypothetical protein [Chryseobacterium caseinilyticum]
MKFILIIFFTLLILSCQKTPVKTEIPKAVKKIEHSETEKDLTEESNLDCGGFFKKIVLSSNLTALKSYEDIFLRIEDISETKIVLEIYVKNTGSDSPTGTRITENTVAWLHFLPGEEKLLDITADPQNPVELSFDENILKKYNYRKICGLTEKDSQTKTVLKSSIECQEIKGVMMKGEECLIRNISLEDAYDEIIKKSLVTDAEFLLKKLPAGNYSQKIGKKGIVEITYRLSQNKIDIEMLYEGGITEIHLMKKDQNVKRQIIYNFD